MGEGYLQLSFLGKVLLAAALVIGLESLHLGSELSLLPVGIGYFSIELLELHSVASTNRSRSMEDGRALDRLEQFNSEKFRRLATFLGRL